MHYQYINDSFNTKIHIASFYSELQKNISRYSHINGIQDYIQKWMKVFLDCYDREKNEKFVFTGKEWYYTEVLIPNCNIRIHFSVSKAKILSKTYEPQVVPISIFSDYDDGAAVIKYTSTPLSNKYDYSKCQEPIIAVNYFYDGFNYLVIDGNHRVTSFKEDASQSIEVKLLSLSHALDLIESVLEKAIYLFLNEGLCVEKFINNSATQYYKNGDFYLPL